LQWRDVVARTKVQRRLVVDTVERDQFPPGMLLKRPHMNHLPSLSRGSKTTAPGSDGTSPVKLANSSHRTRAGLFHGDCGSRMSWVLLAAILKCEVAASRASCREAA
jgi:hypothetical protein